MLTSTGEVTLLWGTSPPPTYQDQRTCLMLLVSENVAFHFHFSGFHQNSLKKSALPYPQRATKPSWKSVKWRVKWRMIMKRVKPLVVSNLPSQEQLLTYPLRQLRKHIQTVRYRKWKGGPHVACQVSDRENSGRTEVETPVDKSTDLEILNFLLDCFYKFFFLQEFGVCLITQCSPVPLELIAMWEHVSSPRLCLLLSSSKATRKRVSYSNPVISMHHLPCLHGTVLGSVCNRRRYHQLYW